MLGNKNQNDLEITGSHNRVIGGNDHSQNTTVLIGKDGKLSVLFKKLIEKYDSQDTISQISNDLRRYTDPKDTIGLEVKLQMAQKEHLLDDFLWLKQEFYKKLVRYQFYEPAQEIFAYILGIVLQKYRNFVRPKIASGESEAEILKCLSNEVIDPILKLIHDEGCDDIMCLTATEIEGMFHYLTGNCHIKWTV